MTDLPIKLFEKYDTPVPRYTSYPTAVQFKTIHPSDYENRLKHFDQKLKNTSIYIHIPFCKTMCLFCGCSVVLNRREDKQQEYVDYLLKEIALVCSFFKNRHTVTQLHFGGGTPTNLNEKQFLEIIKIIKKHFCFSPEIEMSIEIDPRGVIKDSGRKLKFLKEIGFNRISFGVQDTNAAVQEAIRRRQTYQMSLQTYLWGKQLGFDGINLDLIYGLPLQTLTTFKQTVTDILKMKPDRIALFSYAKVPWLKPHQKAIKEAQLPSQKEKFAIYKYARNAFIESGYVAIGMDHFALLDDPLTKAFFSKSLDRNFQGYSLALADDMLGFGMSSIGYVQGGYFQNEKDLAIYQKKLAENILPTARGYILNAKDYIHKWVIKKLMCNFEISKLEFEEVFKTSFDVFFFELEKKIEAFKSEGFINFDKKSITVTEQGKLFIRIIASIFDQYYKCKLNQYSRSV